MISLTGSRFRYVSSQVSVIVPLPERSRPWQPKPDVFVVPGVPAHARPSYDTRTEGPMPPFVLEVASESTWQHDVGEKARLYALAGVQEYLVFDPTAQFLGMPLRGWHRVAGRWLPWPPVQRGWDHGVGERGAGPGGASGRAV
ncbi:MAG TPA: Uma2 family endonuclease, partial [Chloroflexota bacterium]|nr:Uma2 family endonuclease [Chloroflexota bacterium]